MLEWHHTHTLIVGDEAVFVCLVDTGFFTKEGWLEYPVWQFTPDKGLTKNGQRVDGIIIQNDDK